eukprot:symbB.v1.2.020576.t1/scaffold1740.1/size103767/5
MDLPASRVRRCKEILEAAETSAVQLKVVLQELRDMGELSTKLLAETKIGLAVNQLSKDSRPDCGEVRDMAKCLLQDWKQLHRKRKGNEMSESPKKAKAVPEPAKVLQVQTEPVIGVRAKVLEKLQDALKDAGLRCGSLVEVNLAKNIEEALHLKFSTSEQSEKLYMNQSRTILFNLKDPKNQTFSSKLLKGELSPWQLPAMSSEDMASDQKSQARAEQRQQAMQELAVKEDKGQITDVYTCEQCKGKKCSFVMVTPTTCVNGEHSWTSVTCLSCGHRWKA